MSERAAKTFTIHVLPSGGYGVTRHDGTQASFEHRKSLMMWLEEEVREAAFMEALIRNSTEDSGPPKTFLLSPFPVGSMAKVKGA